MINAVEKVTQRLLRATAALESASVPYAVIGGYAVAAWVSRVDEAAVRNTRDVDILLRRVDLEAASKALASAGFVFRHVKGIDMFLDGPDAKARDAVHVIFAGEKVRSEDACPSPDLDESVPDKAFRVIDLPALIRMKLTAFRNKDKTHLDDLIDVGLIDERIIATVPPELAPRLQELIDNLDS
jgi:hypothetical protein